MCPASGMIGHVPSSAVADIQLSVANADASLAASDVELTAEELAQLDELGAPELEYPAWAIASQMTRHGFRVSPRRTPK